MFGRRNSANGLPNAVYVEDVDAFLAASREHPNYKDALSGQHGKIVEEIECGLPNAKLRIRPGEALEGVYAQMVTDFRSLLSTGEPAEMETAMAN